MKLAITPNDTLNFGKGKPSTKGEDSFLADMFPPYPSVFLGALRGSYLSLNADEIPNAGQDNDPTSGFTIGHYSLLLNDILHFPAPADYVWYNDVLNQLRLKNEESLSSNKLPYCLWANHDGKVSPSSDRWISIDTLRLYLSDMPRTIESVEISDFCENEPHIGIARNMQTRTAEKSMLYNVSMTRVKDLSFAIEVDTINKKMPNNGILRLGSRNKTARYEYKNFDSNISTQIDGDIFRLYIATPAIFVKHGWKPDIEKLYGLELLAAAVDGYDCVGGYDIKNNRPKPMRRAVKAGSVYYYRLRNFTHERRAKLIENLHGMSITEERAKEGFGISYIGNVKGEI
ncbi:MAG: hypothetical protein FWD05_03110 [Oscillospiraceae bacterium]|nr:hypothetical protein [Oscillospiraceae bacterium]